MILGPFVVLGVMMIMPGSTLMILSFLLGAELKIKPDMIVTLFLSSFFESFYQMYLFYTTILSVQSKSSVDGPHRKVIVE